MSLSFDTLVAAPLLANFGEVNQGHPIPVYTPRGGTAFAIDGIFQLPTHEALALSDVPPVTTRRPSLQIRNALLPAGVTPAQGDQVVIRTVTYTVSDVRPESVAMTKLMLSEA